MDDELLQLADAYYTVARDMKAKAERHLATAELLGRIADSLCEQNIRAAQQASATHNAEGGSSG